MARLALDMTVRRDREAIHGIPIAEFDRRPVRLAKREVESGTHDAQVLLNPVKVRLGLFLLRRADDDVVPAARPRERERFNKRFDEDENENDGDNDALRLPCLTTNLDVNRFSLPGEREVDDRVAGFSLITIKFTMKERMNEVVAERENLLYLFLRDHECLLILVKPGVLDVWNVRVVRLETVIVYPAGERVRLDGELESGLCRLIRRVVRRFRVFLKILVDELEDFRRPFPYVSIH